MSQLSFSQALIVIETYQFQFKNILTLTYHMFGTMIQKIENNEMIFLPGVLIW